MKAVSFAFALAAALGAAAFVAPPGIARATTSTELTAEERADLARLETYLNGIDTVQARFTQISSAGGLAQGDFYLSRPGRMRIEYDPPIPYLYVANGTWLTFWDEELRQRSDVLLGSTLADFITRDRIRLSGDVTVVDLRHEDGRIKVDLVKTEDPGEGRLTLVFDEEPLQLRSWIVIDAQGTATEVWLSEVQQGVDLDRRLFIAPRASMPTRGQR